MLVCGNHCAAAQNFFPHPNVKFASGMKSAAPISSPPISHEPRGCHIVRYGGVLHTKKATPTSSIGSYNGGVSLGIPHKSPVLESRSRALAIGPQITSFSIVSNA